MDALEVKVCLEMIELGDVMDLATKLGTTFEIS